MSTQEKNSSGVYCRKTQLNTGATSARACDYRSQGGFLIVIYRIKCAKLVASEVNT